MAFYNVRGLPDDLAMVVGLEETSKSRTSVESLLHFLDGGSYISERYEDLVFSFEDWRAADFGIAQNHALRTFRQLGFPNDAIVVSFAHHAQSN